MGLTSYINKAHIVRALLEAICWQVCMSVSCYLPFVMNSCLVVHCYLRHVVKRCLCAHCYVGLSSRDVQRCEKAISG